MKRMLSSWWPHAGTQANLDLTTMTAERIGKVLTIVLAISVVAGCALDPEYRRPVLPIPSRWDSSISGAGAESHSYEREDKLNALMPEERKFLTGFGPNNDLPTLVGNVLLHNRDLQIAALRVDEARALYRVQKAEGVPSLAIGVQQTRERFNDSNIDARYGQNLSVAGVGFSGYDLDFFGRLRSLSESSKHEYLATEYAQQAGRVALIVETLRVYADCLAASDIQEALREILGAEQAQLEISTRQQMLGVISEEDLRSQENASEQARQRWLRARLDYAQATHALRLIAGFVPVDTKSAGSLADLAPDSIQSDSSYANRSSAVLTQRPDILQAEEKLRAANADIGAARAAFFPSIQLTSSVGIASTSLHGLFSSGTGTWLFSPQVSLPIFSGGANRANLDVAQIRKNIAIVEYEKAVQSAFREVADALAAREQLIDQVAANDKILKREENKLVLAAAHFDAGWTDKTSLLAAQIQFKEMYLFHLQNQRALVINSLDLYRAFYGVPAKS
ncbi:MAG: efflux transporter outer membrane subunit [Burkholderiaceae bacterium]|nr:efflux transporter outer membrane subunit [Burkholderiaceae bacterium]